VHLTLNAVWLACVTVIVYVHLATVMQ